MNETEELKDTVAELKKDTNEKIERLKAAVKENQQNRQTQTGEQHRQT